MSTAACALAGCPGDPTEASTISAEGSASAETSAEGPSTLDDDDASVSATLTDSSDSDPTTDPTDSDSDTDPTAPPPECGNRIVEDGEDCDLGAANTMGATCTSECHTNVCGDSYVGYGESCDPPGDGCTAECILESCNNGMLDPGEECDPSLDPDCLPNCLLPEPCGDGTIDPKDGEDCEPGDLGGATCMSIGKGFTGGDLQCGVDCQFVTGSCTTCGDGTAESPTEQCDGADLLGATCVTLGHQGGTLGCMADCTYAEGACHECGNAVQDAGEQCDMDDLAGASCASLGFAPGAGLSCASDCNYDTTACLLCGNNDINGAEECDGTDFGTATCISLGFAEGTLDCTDACEIDDSDCCDALGDACNGAGQCCGSLTCMGNECCIPTGMPCQGSSGNCCSNNCNMGGNGTCMP